MKSGCLLCLLSLSLSSGCVDLSKPKALAECSANGRCSDDPSVQTGGASGGEPDAESDVGVKDDVATGSGGAASTGGASETGGMTGSGGFIGTGGAIMPDGSAGTGGVTGSGGRSSLGGAIGSGGVLGSGGGALGGTSNGGVVGTGGVTGLGGGSSVGGAVSTGGVTGSGGSISSGGVVVAGGVTGSGGKTGSGGVVATGGTVGTGGSGLAGCGTTPSKESQTFDFATGNGSLSLAVNSPSVSRLTHVTTGPAANPSLCTPTAGCAALSMPFTSGAAYAVFALAVENFNPTISLVGSTVTFKLAVDNPGATQVPIQVQAYAQGDKTATYAWTKPATVGGASLDAYSAASGFKDLSLSVVDYTSTDGKYCASVTAAVGIQVQNTAAITSGNAGTVTIYISKITITSP